LSVVSVVCCQVEVSARELITRPEESYRLWCVVVCDLETSRIGAPYIYDISNLRVNLCFVLVLKMGRKKVYCMNNVKISNDVFRLMF